MLHEYEQWKLKEELIAKNDTGYPIFQEYLGIQNDTSYVLKAYIDADRNYKTGGYFASLLLISSASSIIGGLAFVLIVDSKEPKEKKLNFPNPVLKTNPIYYEAYISRVKQIRTDRLVKGGMIGGVIIFLILGALIF